jgi:hypothetical protein
MKFIIFLVVISLVTFSCDFKKSFNKDLVTGLTTTGDGLACEDIYLSVDEEKISRNSFIFGEDVYLNFNNIEGFKTEDENVFPGMQLFVISQTGDTLMSENDLYADYPEGINLSPLQLSANLTVGKPIHSNHGYTLFVKIWDKKGDGTFTAEMDFTVKPNDKLEVSSNKVTFDEIYLFSENRKKVITNNKISFGDNIYIFFEGLSGLNEVEGKVFPGLSFKVTDNADEIILDYSDLFDGYNESGLAVSDFKDEVSANFWFTGSEVNNPLRCEITIWDKQGDANIKARTKVILE